MAAPPTHQATSYTVRQRLGELMREVYQLLAASKELEGEGAFAAAAVLTEAVVNLQDLLTRSRAHTELVFQTLRSALPALQRLREAAEVQLALSDLEEATVRAADASQESPG